MSTSATHDGSSLYDTIIIGAGISGLACAAQLRDHCSRNQISRRILVLEARNRLGGRVASVHVNGCRLDTGANWIHGTGTATAPNPLMDILPKKRLRPLSGSVAFKPPPPEQERKPEDGDWQMVESTKQIGPSKDQSDSKNDLVIPPHIGGTLMGTMWYLFDVLHETASSTPADVAKQTTMLQAIASSDVFREAFEEVPPEFHEALRAMPQFIENMEAAPLAAQSAEGDQGAMGLLEYELDDFEGDQMFVQDGYTAVVEELSRDVVDAGVVDLEAEVEEIAWDQSPLRLRLKDGRKLEATNVVCTLPLGVLKAEQEKLFTPQLPTEKREAIETLGFGTLDKIFLVYDQAWWTEDPYASIIRKGLVQPKAESELLSPQSTTSGTKEPDILMGFTHALPGLSIHPDGECQPGTRILSLANLHSLTGFPVLSCFVSCANAEEIESLSDAHAQTLLHDSLTCWLGQEPPKPTAVHVTRWKGDRLSRGSYSHMIAGLSATEHRMEFQKAISTDGKIKGRLAFAGEHTSRNHFATVHGALISGRREADAIITRWQSE